MGLEKFKTYGFPDIKKLILTEKERYPQTSIPAFMAMRFADFAGEGLKEAEANILAWDKVYMEKYGKPYKVTRDDMDRVSINYLAIVFGLGLKFVEDALVSEEFDEPGFVSEIDKKTYGSIYYGPFHSEARGVQATKINDLQQMRELAKKDRSLSIFFEEEGYPLMPHIIRYCVGDGKNITRIREEVIPLYLPPVALLLTSN